MTSEYSSLITLLLVAVGTPAWVLVFYLKPNRLKEFLRGGESAICLALALDCTRRLLLVVAGNTIPFPADIAFGDFVVTPGRGVALVNVALLGVIAMLVWARLSQTLRHRARNNYAAQVGREQLRELGIDVDAEIAKRKRGNT